MNAVIYAIVIVIVMAHFVIFVFFPTSHPNDISTTYTTHLRNVTPAQKNKLQDKLQDKLQYIQDFVTKDVMCYMSNKKTMLITSLDIVSGFGSLEIQQVLENINKIFTISDIHKYVDIWHPQIASEILVAITQVLGDTGYQNSVGSE